MARISEGLRKETARTYHAQQAGSQPQGGAAGLGYIADDAGAQAWFKEAYNAIQEMEAYNTQNWEKFQRNYGAAPAERIRKVLGNADMVGSYLNNQRNQGRDTGLDQALTEFRTALTGLDRQNQERRAFFSQFGNEQEYSTAKQQYDWQQKYTGQTAEQMRSAASAMEDGDEKTWLTGYADQAEFRELADYDVAAGRQELEQLQNSRREAQRLHARMEQYRTNPLAALVDNEGYNQARTAWETYANAGGMDALEQQIAQKGAYIQSAQQIQDALQQQKEQAKLEKFARSSDVVTGELETARENAQRLKGELENAELYAFRQTHLGSAANPTGSSMDPVAARQERQQAYQEAMDQVAALEAELQASKGKEYAAIARKKDFKDKSQYVSTQLSNGAWDMGTGFSGFLDTEYDYINRNPVAVSRQTMIDQQNGTYFAGTDRSNLQSMTDEEIGIYNYLYATEGREKAREYISFLQSDLNRRQRGAYEDFFRKAAASGVPGAVAASALRVAMSPIKGVAYVGQALDYLTDGKIDQNAGYNRYAYISQAILDETAQQIKNASPKWGEAGAFGYQLGMSMLDFMLAAGISGGSSGIASIIMGTGAAAETVLDAKDRGLDDTQAFTLGTIAGLAETLTEKYSLETLLDPDTLTDSVLKYVGKNMLAEGSEEAASSLVNLMADIIVSKEQSQWQQRIDHYQDLGYSKGEALGKALAEQASAIGLDALGGAISGGILGGVQGTAFALDSRGIGSALKGRGMDAQADQQMIDAGMKAEAGSAARTVAEQMQAKLDAGKTLTAEDRGRLALANPLETAKMLQQSAGKVRLATPQVNVGNDDVRWQQAQRLAGVTGRNIVFYNGSPNENGYFDRKTGEIYVNANGGDPAVQTFAHELTHSTEMAEVYKDLQKICFQKLQSLGQDIGQMRKDKMALYEREGHPLQNESEVDQEILASFVEQYLLTDEQVIADVVYDDPGIGRRILNWIDRILAKLGNESAQERLFLQNARSLYSKALQQTRNRPWRQGENVSDPGASQNAAQGNPEMEASIQEMQEAFERGDLTEDEYNVIVENIRQEFQRRRNAGRQYSINSNYASEIAAWDRSGRPVDASFTLGSTGDVIQGLGAIESDIYINGDKISRILEDHPEMTLEEIKKIPQIVDNPVLVLKSKNVKKIPRNTRLVIFGSVKAQNGQPVLCVLDLRPVENRLVIDDMQKVSSAYTKDDPVSFIQDSDVLYADKKRTAVLLRTIGLHGPIELQQSGYIGSISYRGQNVNIEGVPFTDVIGALNESATRKYSLQQNAEQQSGSDASVRGTLNRKASDYLKGIENRFVRRLGDQLGIPRYAQWDTVRPVIQEMSDEFLKTGRISDDVIAKAFDTAYDQGKVVDREFYDQYKDVKDYLRSTAVTLSERDRADIADFNQWRKGAFGTLRIVNEGGMPVDTAYAELQSMAPGLFPDWITHPADQLQQMAEVGRRIRTVEKSLDEYYGPEAAEFRSWAKHDFGAAVGDMIPELRTVKRYAEQERKADQESPRLKNTAEAQAAFRNRKAAQKAKEGARSRNLLSQKDERIVKQLLEGFITLEDLKDEGQELNLKGIREVYEAVAEYEKIDRQIRRYQAELRQQRQDAADKHLGSSLYWKDKKNGFSYKRETMRRNILDIVNRKADAEALLRDYFEPVQIAEAGRQRFLNEWRDKVRALELATDPAKGDEVSEAYAVQLYGEAITSIEMIENSKGRIKTRDGRTVDEWKGLVQDMFSNSPSLDRAKIEKAVKAYRQMYDELFDKMNEVLVRNGYPPVDYRKGYFPHFQGDDDGIAARFGKLLGISILDDVLPTTINGLTHTFRPGKQWFANAQERLGFKTTYDAVEGFDRYIEGISNVLYHTDNIQKLRALSRQIRYRSSDEGIREQAQAIQEDENLSDYEKEKKLDELYENGKFALANFVRELDEYTNILAGKKSMADRGAEHWLSRKYYTWIKYLEGQVGANMVGGNITSALTNFIPLTQAWGQLDTTNLLAGMRDTLMGMNKTDGFTNESDFLTRRRGSDRLTQSWIQKASATASLPMEWVDNFTSEAITRGAYYQNLKRGMSHEEALHQADIFAADVMADRSKGALPTIFEMRNPFAKIFTQFQTEVNNQMSEVFKDLPRAAKGKAGREIAAMVFKYFVGAWLFNNLYELLIGRRPALDPINMAWEAVEDWQENGLFDAGQNLAASVAENLPFISGVVGGGRVPIASALPNVGNVWQALSAKGYDEETGKGIAMKKRLSMLGSELVKPAMLIAFPFGGNQVMKSWKGIKTVLQGGSYTTNNAGERQLQYAVDTSDPWKLFGKALMASVMGKSALPEAREWTEKGFNTFSEVHTAIYEDLLESGASSAEAYDIINELRTAAKTDDMSRAQVQRKKLEESRISEEGKAIVYYGMLATDKERELMDVLTDTGASADAAGKLAWGLHDIEQLPSEEKKSAQAELLRGSQLTEEEKRVVVGSLLGTELVNENGNPTEYANFLTAADAGLSVDTYMDMRAKGATLDTAFGFMDAGVPCETAADIAMQMKDLVPAAGYKSVSYLQRCQVVLDSDLSEQQKVDALGAVSGLNDSTYEKIRLGYSMGMELQSYVDLRKALPGYDANGNGSYTAKETQAAIDGMLAHLSNNEKAVLWQLQNKSWKPKSNPYDREIGQMVYDAMKASSAQEQEATAEDPYAMMRALGIIP